MNNFVYHNPTKLVFGKGQIAQLAKLIPAGKKIMITCGGGSVRRNGIYDQVVKALEGRDWVEFWGIEPNPSVETVREAIALGREHGSADTYVHVLEQYMTTPGQSRLMDRWAEGILHTVIEIAPRIRENQHDYAVMSEYMLAATLALNDMIRMGVAQDWATHMIGHELTALHGLTHGATLAIVINGTLRVLREQKRGKLLQYGERIWGITGGSDEERIERTIAANEEFFRSLGLSTHLSQEGIGEATIAEIERRFNAAGSRFGEAHNVDGAMARRILEACL